MSVLVLGVGNILLKDEGVGVHAVQQMGERFAFSPEVELLDGGTSGLELLSYLEEREHLVILDALSRGQAPGSIARLEDDEVTQVFSVKLSPHQLGLSDLLATATLMGMRPKNLVLFGVEPKDLGTGLELSGEVEASLEPLLAMVADELRTLGCSVWPKQSHEESA